MDQSPSTGTEYGSGVMGGQNEGVVASHGGGQEGGEGVGSWRERGNKKNNS